ncbi:MAG: TIGR01244 family phosphatase [Rhodobacteraceae bacterium]|nr:TIGR01244 family phosphatase [Paracoccaceae bacterium]MCP5340952.1 TIGR01244 family phosphatase [Paracoccaceae bacterium]
MRPRNLTPIYAVSPQIFPADVAAIRSAGFVRVICNRPDSEIPPEIHADRIRALVEAAGMEFVMNPVTGGAISRDNIGAQKKAMTTAEGPVFAYCASGNRSSIVWALAQAGDVCADELIAAAARWGYDLEPFRAALAAPIG